MKVNIKIKRIKRQLKALEGSFEFSLNDKSILRDYYKGLLLKLGV